MAAKGGSNLAECDRSWARERDARTGAIKEFLAGIKVIKVGRWLQHVLIVQLNAFEGYETQRIGALRDVETSWQRWRYTLGTVFNILADQMPNFAILVTFVFYTKVMGHTLEPATAFVAITVFLRVRCKLPGPELKLTLQPASTCSPTVSTLC